MLTSNLSNNGIGISLGDPGGIGPEVIAKSLKEKSIQKIKSIILIGDRIVLNRYLQKLPQNCSIVDTQFLTSKNFKKGKPSKLNARATLCYMQKSVDLLKGQSIKALVTGPVCKESICLIKPKFQGHTEYLAEAFKVKEVGMLFNTNKMRTIILTRHIPLAAVSKSLTKKYIFDSICLVAKSLKENFKIKNPHIGVCGLNPHAGEGGIIGDEEIKIIIPAIKQARQKRIKVTGPLSADTLFTPQNIKGYDCIVAMYHDQGLIPIKQLYFNEVVNLTIGLPFIRTSPAHGTAFDIVGQNKANPSSMIEAIKLASKLSK